jgi:hypothetical protein
MTRLNDNIFRGWLLLVLFVALLLKSCAADAQEQVKYLGYEISTSLPFTRLSSNIPQLQGMDISYTGLRVGGIVATHCVKYKATIGLHYSSASLPYSFDLFTGSLNTIVYPLKMTSLKPNHTFEPYLLGGLRQGQTKYFGQYLISDPDRNYSKSKEPLLGSTYSTQLVGGVGIEYQLENENNNFIHFFCELNYGNPIHEAASSQAFVGTRMKSSWTVIFGINFGTAKKS